MKNEEVSFYYSIRRIIMSKRAEIRQILVISGAIIAFFILFAIILSSTTFSQERDPDQVRRAAEEKYLRDSTIKTIYKNGDYMVDDGEVVRNNIVVTEGNLTVRGSIRGTVITVFGDIEIESKGEIVGDVICISGDIIKSNEALITGDEVETSWLTFADRERDRDWRDRYYRRRDVRYVDRDRNRKWEDYLDEEEYMFRYNKVDGLFLGAQLPKDNWYNDRLLAIYGFVGYGFKSSAWRYTAGIERSFFDKYRFSFGLKAYSLTDTDDEWFISRGENTLAAFVFKEDYHDYFERTGFTGYISQKFYPDFNAQLEYRIDSYYNMVNNTHWALFGGNKRFIPNKQIDEGDMRSVLLKVDYDSRYNYRGYSRGWYGLLTAEVSDPDIGGDFSYKRFIFDIRRYQPLGRYENLDMRIRIGSSTGDLPRQKLFYLGGIGTMRGYGFKSMEGNRVILGNIEYKFDPYGLLAGPPSWLLEDFNLILFADVGYAWYNCENSNFTKFFNGVELEDLKTAVGVGLSDKDDEIRINFAWRTDKKGESVQVYLRINQTF